MSSQSPAPRGGVTVPKPSKLLAEMAALAGVILVGGFVGYFVIDQIRHWTDDQYRLAQRQRYAFVCHEHAVRTDQISETAGLSQVLAQTEARVNQQLNIARQEVAPTDILGKLGQFALCADFTKVGIGGFAISGTDRETAALRRLETDVIGVQINRIKFLAADYDEFPPDVALRITQDLVALQNALEDAAAKIPGDPAPEPSGPSAAPDDKWIIVAGGDQSDAAARDQVAAVQRAIEAAGITQATGPAQIYLVRSWRRTVVPFGSEAAANAALTQIRPALKYGGYVRKVAEWCPNLSSLDPILGILTSRCSS